MDALIKKEFPEQKDIGFNRVWERIAYLAATFGKVTEATKATGRFKQGFCYRFCDDNDNSIPMA